VDERRPGVELPASTRDVNPAWPEIDGIDSRDARGRLGGDLDLFRTLLRRLCEEFADLVAPVHAGDPKLLADQAARMHKLMGISGQLGAKAIYELARKTEDACRRGESTRALQLQKRLASEFERLNYDARLHLLSPMLTPESTPSDNPGLSAGELDELCDLLRQQSLSALDCFGPLAPRLKRRLGKEAFERLRGHMDNLEFAAVAQVLQSMRDVPSSTAG
jgi:HPt (histidine-containing phosphotransfer) domain-containing protein